MKGKSIKSIIIDIEESEFGKTYNLKFMDSSGEDIYPAPGWSHNLFEVLFELIRIHDNKESIEFSPCKLRKVDADFIVKALENGYNNSMERLKYIKEEFYIEEDGEDEDEDEDEDGKPN